MRAVTIIDGTLRWNEHPDPVPGPGEVSIAVRAAGVNPADALQLKGFYPAPPGSPADIPGLEAAGEVVAVGPSTTRFSVGDRVMALVAGGAQAERLVLHESCVLPVPDCMGWAEAGGFCEVAITAHDALFTQAGLAVGERVCVQGAAGGVGTAAIQLAKAAGATVVASVRATELHDQVRSLGADVVATPDAFEEHGPFDVILELIGAANLTADVGSLATGGRIVVIGVGGGARGELDLLRLMNARGRILGSTLRARPLEGKAAAVAAVGHHVLPLAADGRLTVPVTATYEMADVASAHERLAAGGKLGKIVLLSEA
jgi:NADPH:quinone reductase-like Zn-dependent oxidoreductase